MTLRKPDQTVTTTTISMHPTHGRNALTGTFAPHGGVPGVGFEPTRPSRAKGV